VSARRNPQAEAHATQLLDQATQLLDQLREQGVNATNLCTDSRAMTAGDVFLAYPGAHADGRRYIAEAAARGARAVLWECAEFAPQDSITLPNIGVGQLQELSGYLAHLVYGRPSEKLWLAGVTGTNGKTSVSQWLAQAMSDLGRRCAVVGTLGNGFPGALEASANTTPDAITLHRSLAAYRAQSAQAVVMEVSSIGLDQGRVNAAVFAVAIFTNLTRDHLEYHGTMENYAEAKARLFQTPGLQTAVLNLDDAFGRELMQRLAGSGVRRIAYSIENPAGDCGEWLLRAENISATVHGQRFDAVTPQGRATLNVPHAGRFNISNLLAVLAALLAADIPLAQAVNAVSKLTPPPGRMQMLGGEGVKAEPLIVVDYAHTPDALEQALTALTDTARARGGKLICVFGCGGERDAGKRPLMGAVAARCADLVVLTSDNPRGEKPGAIIEQIAASAPQATIIEDRAQAICRVVAAADQRDVVLIAGKGHEPYQEIAGQRLPFSDIEQARDALAARKGRCS